MKNGAADWITCEALSFATYDERNIDIHHVFPEAWCKQERLSPDLYNSIINKTPINARTNKVIGGRAPSAYLPRLGRDTPEGRLDGLLASHWIDHNHLERDAFGDSFIQRGQHMLDLIGMAMGRDLGDGKPVFRESLTKGGVSGYVEDEDTDYAEVGESEQEESDAA